MDKGEKNDFGQEIISWIVPEFEKHIRDKKWYIGALLVGILLLLYALFSHNYYFAVIILISGLILVLNDGQNPLKVRIAVTEEGLAVGKKFYDYDEIKCFYIVYKPRLEVKSLYIEFKNFFHHRLSIPLIDINPLMLRDELLKYLPENLDKLNEPLSEGIAKRLKI